MNAPMATEGHTAKPPKHNVLFLSPTSSLLKEELNTAHNALFLVLFPSLSKSVHSQILRLKWIKEPWANSSSINVASGFGTHVQLQHPNQLWQCSVPTYCVPGHLSLPSGFPRDVSHFSSHSFLGRTFYSLLIKEQFHCHP